MPNSKPHYFIPIALGAVLLISLFLFWPAPLANAQCGSQASSCKNCHEVQAQKPVNNDGTTWHTQHQQIDACVSCHAGNPQSMEAADSHAGMVSWNSDIKAGCFTCHPNDYLEKAQVYATALGVQIVGGDTTSDAGVQPTPSPQPSAASTPLPSIVVSEPGIIDYSSQYNETVLGKHPVNWGDVIVILMILAIAFGGGGFVYWNERRQRGLKGFLPQWVTRTIDAQFKSSKAGLPIAVVDYPSEVLALLPLINQLNPVGLHSLKRLLQDHEQANSMLYALSHLDPELIKRIRSLDPHTRQLLLALAGS